MIRKAFVAFAVFAVLSVFGGLADTAVADGGSGGGTSLIPPRCC